MLSAIVKRSGALYRNSRRVSAISESAKARFEPIARVVTIVLRLGELGPQVGGIARQSDCCAGADNANAEQQLKRPLETGDPRAAGSLHLSPGEGRGTIRLHLRRGFPRNSDSSNA